MGWHRRTERGIAWRCRCIAEGATWEKRRPDVVTDTEEMIALATVGREHSTTGTLLRMEMTVEAVRLRCPQSYTSAIFNPARKTAVPVV